MTREEAQQEIKHFEDLLQGCTCGPDEIPPHKYHSRKKQGNAVYDSFKNDMIHKNNKRMNKI
jgi:hypothetical protein